MSWTAVAGASNSFTVSASASASFSTQSSASDVWALANISDYYAVDYAVDFYVDDNHYTVKASASTAWSAV